VAETKKETRPPSRDDQLVPGWLALVVLLLLIAVVAVGGFVVRGLMSSPREMTPAQADIVTGEAAVKADPTNTDAMLDLAYAYQRDGQSDKAIAEYALVLKTDPKNTAALYNTGLIQIQIQTGKGKAGETSLWAVLKIDPTHALAAKALGDYYASKKQYKSLLVAVGPVAKANPDLADLQYLLGLAYENLGQKTEAIAAYSSALQFAPDLKGARDALRRLQGGK
jgi:tetratricopeptide (TPR) repeat protein